MSPAGVWMTTEDVAEEFRFREVRNARRWLERERVQAFKRGRVNLYRRDDVEGRLRVTKEQRSR
jgi:hypothetical protein